MATLKTYHGVAGHAYPEEIGEPKGMWYFYTIHDMKYRTQITMYSRDPRDARKQAISRFLGTRAMRYVARQWQTV